MDSKEIKLYAFCVPENYTSAKELVINIDKSLKSIFDVTWHIGKMLYEYEPFENPYESRREYRFHFGGNTPSAFIDYLTDYVNKINPNISLRFNWLSQGRDTTDKEIYTFINTFIFCQRYRHLGNRVSLFVSDDILTVYLNETNRLGHLDTAPEDYVYTEIDEFK